jgi:glycosyltransferase involved in cell wall biosynthesis
MVTREFPPESGGIGYYVYNLSKKLVERGHRVTIITRGTFTRSVKYFVEGIDVFRVSFFPLYPFHLSIHGIFLNNLFKNLEPSFDLVHVHSPLPPLVKTCLPIMTTVHTSMRTDSKYHEVFDFYSLLEKLQSMYISPPIESKLFRISNKITAVSCSVVEELKDYGLDEKITVLGNGVNEKLFAPINKDKNGRKYVLYTGILRARKGLFDLVECAKLVSEITSDVEFIICGKGPFSRKLEAVVRAHKLQRTIKLLGFVERKELIKLYQNAALHVVPSHYEGLPTVLLEAMSCGLPVVATDVCGNKEVIVNGVNGFLVPPKSPMAMAKVILRLLQNDQISGRVGRAARRTIEDKYTWDKITDNVLASYSMTLNDHK